MKWICVAAFVLAVGQVAAGNDDLAKALKGVVDADSCAFVITDGGAGKGTEGKFQKGLPLQFKADGIEFFRKGDIMVYKQGDTWQRTRTGTLSDPLRILGASAKVRAARTPSEELTMLAKTVKKATKEKASVRTTFGEDEARELARTEDRDLARNGTAKFWIDGEGRLTKYEFTIRVLGRRGNADVDGVVVKTVTLEAVGKTKIEVPAAAKKAMDKE